MRSEHMKKERPQVAVAQLGARMHYAVPRILQEGDMLSAFYTDICATKGWPRLLQAVPASWCPIPLRRLRERVPDGVPTEKTVAYTSLGGRYARRLRRAKGAEERMATYLWGGREFGEAILKTGLPPDTSAVYAFKSAALEIFESAQVAFNILEQPSAPVRAEDELLGGESNLHSAWLPHAADLYSHRQELSDREQREWQLADLILCPSDFVAQKIAQCGGPGDRCVVVPYGINHATNSPKSRGSTDKELRVLSVGRVSLSKGAFYTWQAAQKRDANVRFRMVGSIDVSESAKRKLAKNVELIGAVPRSDVTKHYEWADVFLLPSICEGSATVTYEALAAGLPVICTPNTGSIIRDGKDGFIVPVQNGEAIAERLNELSSNRDMLKEMSRSAYGRYASCGTLEAYAHRLQNTILNVFD